MSPAEQPLLRAARPSPAKDLLRPLRRGLNSETGEAGFSLILLLSALIGMGAFLLPFFNLKAIDIEMKVRGYLVVKQAYCAAKSGKNSLPDNYRSALKFFGGLIEYARGQYKFAIKNVKQNAKSFKTMGKMFKWTGSALKGLTMLLSVYLIIIGPVVFGIIGFKHFIRFVGGEKNSSGLLFGVIFSLLMFTGITWFGKRMGGHFTLSSFIGLGYWLSMLSVLGGSIPKLFSRSE